MLYHQIFVKVKLKKLLNILKFTNSYNNVIRKKNKMKSGFKFKLKKVIKVIERGRFISKAMNSVANHLSLKLRFFPHSKF